MTWPVELSEETLAVECIDSHARYPWVVRHLPTSLMCLAPDDDGHLRPVWRTRAAALAVREHIIATQDPGFREVDVRMAVRILAEGLA